MAPRCFQWSGLAFVSRFKMLLIKHGKTYMHTNLKAAIASGLAFFVMVVPGLSDVVHEAGGSEAVVGAVVSINVLLHATLHWITK